MDELGDEETRGGILVEEMRHEHALARQVVLHPADGRGFEAEIDLLVDHLPQFPRSGLPADRSADAQAFEPARQPLDEREIAREARRHVGTLHLDGGPHLLVPQPRTMNLTHPGGRERLRHELVEHVLDRLSELLLDDDAGLLEGEAGAAHLHRGELAAQRG